MDILGGGGYKSTLVHGTMVHLLQDMFLHLSSAGNTYECRQAGLQYYFFLIYFYLAENEKLKKRKTI